MADKIPCDYRTHKHIPSRSCYQLIFEVSEELFPVVCDTLGFPKAGVNTYVNIELLTPENIKSLRVDNPLTEESSVKEKSEGKKVFALSHIRCNDKNFQAYVAELGWNELTPKDNATDYLYNFCDIVSRSELTTDVAAQKLFRELDQKFKKWWAEKGWETINQDNVNREPTILD